MPAAVVTALPEAVVFDLDGLMVDTERLDRFAWYAVATRRGFPMSDALHALTIGRREGDVAEEFRARLGSRFDFAAAASDVRTWREDYIGWHGLAHKPGLDELLDCLEAAKIPCAVATSTLRVPALHSMGVLATRMRAAVFGEDVAAGKPAPDTYLLAAERLKVPPKRCLALEDSLPGIVAAEAAGMTAVMIPDLVAPHAGVRYVCRSLLGVRDWLLAASAGSS